MDFGIALATTVDAWRWVKRAEELGFSHAWFYDTQMLCADPFVAMALAAANTEKIRLGTGVLIPSNRLALEARSRTHRLRRRHRLHGAAHHGPRRHAPRRDAGVRARRVRTARGRH